MSKPRTRFVLHPYIARQAANVWGYSPSLDGKRFLVAESISTATPTVHVILNWQNAIPDSH